MLYVYSAVAFDGKAFFVGSNGVDGDQLWSSDGTVAGTNLVDDLGGSFGPDATLFTPLNGELFFVDQDNAWVTDGTNAGTVELSGAYGKVSEPVLLDGKIYFRGYSTVNPAYSDGLYVTDGTEAGTKLVFADGGLALTVAGDNLFFVSEDATNGLGVFAYNALSNVTTLVTPLSYYAGTGTLGVAIGNELFFTVPQSAEGVVNGQLWVTDGAAGSAVMLANAPSSSDSFTNLTALDGKLYFASTGDSHPGLWVSDGTSAGTSEILALPVSDLTAVGNTLYFVATDATHGSEVWSYSPIAGTASLVVDADPGPTGSSPSNITAGNGGVYFIANDATSANELWYVNRAGGVMELTSPSNGELLANDALTAIGGKLYFAGLDSVHGEGLFVTNGFQVTFLAAVTINDPLSFSDVGGLLYFQGDDAASGSQLWVSDGTPTSTHPVTDAGPPTVPNDFNGDGFSDILFGQTNGALATWQMNGTSIIGGGNIGSPGGTWAEVGTGDFNGDGTADVLFQDASHNLAIWEMNGTAIIGGGDIGNPGGTWHVAGVGDFNGDGLSDILFQDASSSLAIWDMNGTSIIGGGNIGNPGGTWAEKAIGDFNGDGKSDILFQDASGDLAIWEMNGTAIIGGGDIGNPGSGWTVEGTGDFNGDGMSDILFENSSTGDYAIWYMNGTSIIGGGDIGDPGGTWQFAGIGNYNGDRDADILFTDAAGDLAIWEMNGAAIIGGGNIGNPGSEWHVLS